LSIEFHIYIIFCVIDNELYLIRLALRLAIGR